MDPAIGVRVTPTGVAILLLFAGIVWLISRDDYYSRIAKQFRSEYLDQVEDDDSFGVVVSSTRIARLAVAHARTELGLLTDNPANRLVVSDVVRRYLKERGLRPTHISQHFPVCVEVYFMRSSHDEFVRKVRDSTFARRVRRRGGETL